MNTQPVTTERERGILREIGGLSDRLRQLRSTGALRNAVEIKAIETQSRAKWEELRSLRAGPENSGAMPPRERGHYS